MTRYFPELIAAAAAELPERCVIDGEIVIATDHGLDFEALQQRIHPADSRVRMLAKQTPASFIAFDLLALGDDDYTKRPFNERRAALVDALTDAGPWFHVTPATTELTTAQLWFDEFAGAGLDGLIAKPLTITYQPDKRVCSRSSTSGPPTAWSPVTACTSRVTTRSAHCCSGYTRTTAHSHRSASSAPSQWPSDGNY